MSHQHLRPVQVLRDAGGVMAIPTNLQTWDCHARYRSLAM